MKYLCIDCNKRFKTKKLFEKHSELCCILSNLNKECFDNNRIFKEVLYTMFGKIHSLENEVYELKNFISKTKKKIQIVQWLNENRKPTYSLQEFIEKFEITETHLYLIFDKNYVEGMYYILNDAFDIQYIEEHPICCFKQKNNTLYGYIEKKWIVMDKNIFSQCIQKLHLKILEYFQQWTKKNQEKIDNDQDFYSKYLVYMKHITGGTYSKEKSNALLFSKVYNYLKMNVKEIIQYEFSF